MSGIMAGCENCVRISAEYGEKLDEVSEKISKEKIELFG